MKKSIEEIERELVIYIRAKQALQHLPYRPRKKRMFARPSGYPRIYNSLTRKISKLHTRRNQAYQRAGKYGGRFDYQQYKQQNEQN